MKKIVRQNIFFLPQFPKPAPLKAGRYSSTAHDVRDDAAGGKTRRIRTDIRIRNRSWSSESKRAKERGREQQWAIRLIYITNNNGISLQSLKRTDSEDRWRISSFQTIIRAAANNNDCVQRRCFRQWSRRSWRFISSGPVVSLKVETDDDHGRRSNSSGCREREREREKWYIGRSQKRVVGRGGDIWWYLWYCDYGIVALRTMEAARCHVRLPLVIQTALSRAHDDILSHANNTCIIVIFLFL